MSNETAVEVLGKLDAALDEYEPGYANSEGLKAFQSILKELNDSDHAPTNLIAEKIGSIREWVSILYSPRKHQKHGGVDRVKLFIRQDLASLRSIVSSEKNKGA